MDTKKQIESSWEQWYTFSSMESNNSTGNTDVVEGGDKQYINLEPENDPVNDKTREQPQNNPTNETSDFSVDMLVTTDGSIPVLNTRPTRVFFGKGNKKT